MINPAQIPDEVVEELHSLDAWRGSASEARAAIAAAFAAWPGAEIDDSQYGGDFLILPLTQQASDE
jgi:hypothetical protein